MGEREARKPGVTCWVDTQAGCGRHRGGGHGVVCEHHTLRLPRRPRRRHDQRVTGLDRKSIGQFALFAVGADDAGRSERVEQDPLGDRRQPGIERRRGIAGVPDRPEGVHKPHSTREVECNELWHWPVA